MPLTSSLPSPKEVVPEPTCSLAALLQSFLPGTMGLDKRAAQLAFLGIHNDASFVATSSDGRYAVSRSQAHAKTAWPQHEGEDPDTRVWDLKAKCMIWQGNLEGFTALSVAVDLAAGRYVFCNNRSLLVWPMDEKLPSFTIDSKPGSGGYSTAAAAANDCSVAISADGLYAVSCGDLHIKVWDLEQRRCIGSGIKSREGKPQGVCVSADRRYAAVTQSKPDELQIVDLEPGSKSSAVANLPGRYDWASFNISPDRRYAVSTAADMRKGLQLWEFKAWYEYPARPIATLHGLVGPVRSVAVGADKRVVTITGDAGSATQLHVWDARPWWQRILCMPDAP